jgi:CBS domain-containing protein
MTTSDSARPPANKAVERPIDVRDTPVAEVMGRPPATVDMSLSLDLALWTFAGHELRHLAVVDAAGACVGCSVIESLRQKWSRDPMLFDRTLVRDVCHGLPPLVRVDATLADAASTMRRRGTDAVVVVDDRAVRSAW